jgi:hypothetical protein
MSLHNAALTVRIGSQSIEVIQNPTSIELRQLDKEFKRDFPNQPTGTKSVRTYVDDKGNTYVWKSHTCTHGRMEPALNRIINTPEGGG